MSTKTTLIALFLLVVTFGVIGYFSPLRQSPEPAGCTMEAMLCPDGSTVGRTGPNCEFAACPDFTPAGDGSGQGILPYNSGVGGVVLLGPTCPVVQSPPDPACDDKPYETSISVFRAGDLANAFAVSQSDSNGNFEVSLPPGEYIVRAGNGDMLPRCAQVSATVDSDAYTDITLSCDTGIR